MKTQEQLDAAIEAIRSVCEAHGVALVGTCNGEGIYGELTIVDAAKMEKHKRERNVVRHCSYGEKEPYVEIIEIQPL